MSLIIFFGFALFIFLLGVAVVSVTLYHWYKLSKEAKSSKNSELEAQKKLAEISQ